MAHIIEVVRDTAGEARSFLDALFYSDAVSAIGHRTDDEGETRAVAAGWNADEAREIDERISQMISDALRQGRDEDVGEIAAYCRIFPEIVLYQPELTDVE